jgi:hypothetical protein
MLKNKERTKGRKYPRRIKWIPQRDEAFERAGKVCEISGDPLGRQVPERFYPPRETYWEWARAADHLIPERYVRRFIKGADPHIAENIFVITPALHARKTACEPRLYTGDFIGFCQDLRRLGWDQFVIDQAVKALYASAKKKERCIAKPEGV